jgi:hypothetical protein
VKIYWDALKAVLRARYRADWSTWRGQAWYWFKAAVLEGRT